MLTAVVKNQKTVASEASIVFTGAVATAVRGCSRDHGKICRTASKIAFEVHNLTPSCDFRKHQGAVFCVLQQEPCTEIQSIFCGWTDTAIQSRRHVWTCLTHQQLAWKVWTYQHRLFVDLVMLVMLRIVSTTSMKILQCSHSSSLSTSRYYFDCYRLSRNQFLHYRLLWSSLHSTGYEETLPFRKSPAEQMFSNFITFA